MIVVTMEQHGVPAGFVLCLRGNAKALVPAFPYQSFLVTAKLQLWEVCPYVLLFPLYSRVGTSPKIKMPCLGAVRCGALPTAFEFRVTCGCLVALHVGMWMRYILSAPLLEGCSLWKSSLLPTAPLIMLIILSGEQAALKTVRLIKSNKAVLKTACSRAKQTLQQYYYEVGFFSV